MANVLKIIHFTGPVKLFFPKVCYKVDFKIIKNEFIMRTFIDTINFGVKTGGFPCFWACFISLLQSA